MQASLSLALCGWLSSIDDPPPMRYQPSYVLLSGAIVGGMSQERAATILASNTASCENEYPWQTKELWGELVWNRHPPVVLKQVQCF